MSALPQDMDNAMSQQQAHQHQNPPSYPDVEVDVQPTPLEEELQAEHPSRRGSHAKAKGNEQARATPPFKPAFKTEDAKVKRSSGSLLAMLALAAAVVCAGVLGMRYLRKPTALPVIVEPVETADVRGTSSAAGGTGADPATIVARAEPAGPSTAIGAEPDGLTATAAPASEALAGPLAGEVSGAAANESTPSAAKPLGPATAPTSGAEAVSQVAQVGINASFASAITQLQADVAALKGRTNTVGAGAGGTAATGSSGTPVRRVARARPVAPATTLESADAGAAVQARGAVLAVDLWDGRASVVVGTGQAQDKRVQFLHEGDRRNGITLKTADVRRQQAVFDVQGQEARFTAETQSRD